MKVYSLLLFALLAPAEGQSLDAILRKVEQRYNRIRTLAVGFEQRYTMPGFGRRVEAGELLMHKPGRMRWNYTTPPGKLFLTDGKFSYLYTPGETQVERISMKDSGDLRTPLSFLVGRLDFKRFFNRFELRAENGDPVIRAFPKNERAPFVSVEFAVTEEGLIKRLSVAGHDRSVMEYVFSNERLNPQLDNAIFRFTAPPGVSVVETTDLER